MVHFDQRSFTELFLKLFAALRVTVEGFRISARVIPNPQGEHLESRKNRSSPAGLGSSAFSCQSLEKTLALQIVERAFVDVFVHIHIYFGPWTLRKRLQDIAQTDR